MPASAVHVHDGLSMKLVTASNVAGTGSGSCTRPRTMSGSLRPWPVRTLTTVPSGALPSPASLRSPAIPAAEAGSQKTPSSLGEHLLGGQYLRVRDALYGAAGVAGRGEGSFFAGRRTYPDGARHGLGVLEVVAGHQRRSSLGLKPEHAWSSVGVPGLAPFAKAFPVGGDISRVSHGQGQGVGGTTERFRYLEGGRLLALDAVGVDRVHQRDVAEFFGDPLRKLQGRVEVAFDLDYSGPVREDLYGLAQRDLARRHDHKALHAGPCGVGRRRGRRVSRRGTDAGPAPRGDGPAHGHRHAAILERGRRVHPLELQEQARAHAFRDGGSYDQGRPALADGGDGVIGYLRQPPTIPLYNTLPENPRLNAQYKPRLSPQTVPVSNFGPEDLTYHAKEQAFNNGAILVGCSELSAFSTPSARDKKAES